MDGTKVRGVIKGDSMSFSGNVTKSLSAFITKALTKDAGREKKKESPLARVKANPVVSKVFNGILKSQKNLVSVVTGFASGFSNSVRGLIKSQEDQKRGEKSFLSRLISSENTSSKMLIARITHGAQRSLAATKSFIGGIAKIFSSFKAKTAKVAKSFLQKILSFIAKAPVILGMMLYAFGPIIYDYFTKFMDGIFPGFKEDADALVETIRGLVLKAWEMIKKIGGEAIKFLTAVIDGAPKAFETTITKISEAVSSVKDFLSNISTTIGDIIDSVTTYIDESFTKIKNWFTQTDGPIAKFLSAGKLVLSYIFWPIQVFKSLYNWFTKAGGGLEKIKKFLKPIGDAFKKIVGYVGGILSSVLNLEKIGNMLQAVFEAADKIASDFFDDPVTTLKNLGLAFVDAIVDTFHRVKDFLSGVLSDISRVVGESLSKVGSKISGAFDWITAKFQEYVIDPITGLFSSIKTFASDVVDWVISKIPFMDSPEEKQKKAQAKADKKAREDDAKRKKATAKSTNEKLKKSGAATVPIMFGKNEIKDIERLRKANLGVDELRALIEEGGYDQKSVNLLMQVFQETMRGDYATARQTSDDMSNLTAHATKKGSIYTHDIHTEEALGKMLKALTPTSEDEGRERTATDWRASTIKILSQLREFAEAENEERKEKEMEEIRKATSGIPGSDSFVGPLLPSGSGSGGGDSGGGGGGDTSASPEPVSGGSAGASFGDVTPIDSSGMVVPTKTPVITSAFGPRNVKGGSKNHKGVDIRGRLGDPVFAFKEGQVNIAKLSPWGNVGISHSDGMASRYIHLDSISVKQGQQVKAGQFLGTAGGRGPNGRSQYVPHLHFEIHRGGRPVDPEPILKSIKGGGIHRKGEKPPMSDAGVQGSANASMGSTGALDVAATPQAQGGGSGTEGSLPTGTASRSQDPSSTITAGLGGGSGMGMGGSASVSRSPASVTLPSTSVAKSGPTPAPASSSPSSGLPGASPSGFKTKPPSNTVAESVLTPNLGFMMSLSGVV